MSHSCVLQGKALIRLTFLMPSQHYTDSSSATLLSTCAREYITAAASTAFSLISFSRVRAREIGTRSIRIFEEYASAERSRRPRQARELMRRPALPDPGKRHMRAVCPARARVLTPPHVRSRARRAYPVGVSHPGRACWTFGRRRGLIRSSSAPPLFPSSLPVE